MKSFIRPLAHVLGLMVTFTALTSSATGAPNTSPETCSTFNLSGTYQYSLERGTPYQENINVQMSQIGCQLTVVDEKSRASWLFDLTGNTEATVPQQIIYANRHSEFARRSLESMRIRTRVTYVWGGIPRIELIISQNLPKVADTPEHQGNSVDVDVRFTADVSIFAWMGRDSDNVARARQIDGIGISNTLVRLVRVNHHPFLVGPLSTAFSFGANYVLKWSDGVLDSSLPFFNLRKIR